MGDPMDKRTRSLYAHRKSHCICLADQCTYALAAGLPAARPTKFILPPPPPPPPPALLSPSRTSSRPHPEIISTLVKPWAVERLIFFSQGQRVSNKAARSTIIQSAAEWSLGKTLRVCTECVLCLRRDNKIVRPSSSRLSVSLILPWT